MRNFIGWALGAWLPVGLFACGSAVSTAPPRAQVRCEQVEYEGIRTEGGVGVLNVAKVGATYEQQAIREMDVYVERYRAGMADLCRMYQAGAIGSEEYLRESRELRALLEPASEYVQRLNGTRDYGERKQVISALYTTLVPAEVREQDLTLAFAVEAVLPDGRHIVTAAGEPLPTGTQVRFRVDVNQSAYVYIFQRNTSARGIRVLFPHQRIGTGNPLAADVPQLIPPSEYYVLNEQDVGIEHVYIVVSPRSVRALDAVVARAATNPVADIDQNPTLAQLPSLAPGRADGTCRTRALELPGDPAHPPACTRTRGLVLSQAPGAPRPASMVVRADPGDDTIVKDFPFEHVTREGWQGRTNANAQTRGLGMLTEW